MYIFYAVAILIGVICISISFLVLMIDRKKSEDLLERLDIRREDVLEVINDAEQIVIEMNNFADYLFEKIDSKVSEINDIEKKDTYYINEIEGQKERLQESRTERVQERIKEKTQERIKEITTERQEVIAKASGSEADFYESQPYYRAVYNSNSRLPKKENAYIHKMKTGSSIDIKVNEDVIDIKELFNISKDKVIPMNPRYPAVYALLDQGCSELEIARRLNMGIGEIKLIIGVKR